MKVLIVEDDPVLALLLREQVMHAGHEVCDWALNGEDSAQRCVECSPDLVIIDTAQDSFTSGAEVVQAIRDVGPVHIAFVTEDDVAPSVLKDLAPLGILTTSLDPAQLSSLLQLASTTAPRTPARVR